MASNENGAVWLTGTAVSGTASSINMNVNGAKIGDMYLNTSTGNIYKAVSTNTWKYIMNIMGPKGNSGSTGKDGIAGATYTPVVSNSGVLAWTNDKGLPNPSPVNIKGSTPIVRAEVGNGTGVPTVEVKNDGATTTFVFNNLKGEANSITVDSKLDINSDNTVQNRAVAEALVHKLDRTDLSAVGWTGSYSDLIDKPVIDSSLNANSVNAIQNKVVYTMLNNKVDKTALAVIATSGNYNDLINKPRVDKELNINSTNAVQNKTISAALEEKMDKVKLSAVATTGSYNDLSDRPTIPSLVGYATRDWVIDQGYVTANTWRANTANFEGYVVAGAGHVNKVWKTDENGVPAWREDNDTKYDLSEYATQKWVNSKGFLTKHQNLDNYATKDWVFNAMAGIKPEVVTYKAGAGVKLENNTFNIDCIHGGTEVPDNSLGNNGDIYILY